MSVHKKKKGRKISAFQKEWKKVAQNYPKFARAYALQQAEIVKLHLVLSDSICDKVRRGEILMAQETYRKYCRNFANKLAIETQTTKFIECINGPDPSIC
jgi:hypothetical protein